MLIFISPSKTFTDHQFDGDEILFSEKSNYLKNEIKQFNETDMMKHFKVSDILAKEILSYYHDNHLASKAIYRYGGVLYKALDPLTIDFNQENKIFILSAQYGLLRQFDGIHKYRIDYNHRMLGNLYSYWKKDIHNYLNNFYKNDLLIDLTSKEFEQLIPENKIRIEFELNEKKISTVLLKQMRG